MEGCTISKVGDFVRICFPQRRVHLPSLPLATAVKNGNFYESGRTSESFLDWLSAPSAANVKAMLMFPETCDYKATGARGSSHKEKAICSSSRRQSREVALQTIQFTHSRATAGYIVPFILRDLEIYRRRRQPDKIQPWKFKRKKAAAGTKTRQIVCIDCAVSPQDGPIP